MSKFGDEIILHSELHHPNIVKLLGVHYPEGSQLPMLVMEYLPHTLQQLIERKEAINKDAILLDVANGLNYLHSHRPPIIHRDIKADNILLTVDHKAKITDLGMSKLCNTLKQNHNTTAPGCPNMMPPEALVSNPVYNEKLDVFSFGCLILHMLTGDIIVPTDPYIPKPYDPGSFIKVSEWDRRAKYIEPVLGDKLIPLARKCLQDDPSKRINAVDIIETIQFHTNEYQQPSCSIFIKYGEGKTLTISIPEKSFCETMITELKIILTKRMGIPNEDMRLICCGKQLEDSKTFEDYNIKEGSTIFVVLRLCGK